MSNALTAAQAYVARGWNPLPLPFKTTKAVDPGWEQRVIRAPDIPQHFNGKPQNVGVVLGPTSNGLTDIDLDCREAVELAPQVLPKTDAIFGRASAPASHWLYRSTLSTLGKAEIQFRDPMRPTGRVMLLEVRIGGVKGAQTVFPGSVHESDEEIRWDEAGNEAEIPDDDLLKRARLLASICLLARYWPGIGARHDAALSLGGYLARVGLKTPQVKYLAEAIARTAGDPEHQDRKATAEDAAQEFHAGRPARGYPLLAKTFGKEVARQVADWLDYKGSTAGAIPSTGVEPDLNRLNKAHAVLPIGGKTRVVTFGEMPDFPGRETIVMTQTIPDFRALHNKYRHTYEDDDGEPQSMPLGNYWIGSQFRRQYDGGMAFMPQRDGDAGDKLNLWRGFGVKPAKGDCSKFLGFARDIICGGIAADFDYLIRREAFIVQKRTRSEVALGLQTKEEGCGKGFYERTLGYLLGTHAMLITNPKHIIGAFNPHLETLLRVTADEALFVGNHEHRNALFNLITEDTLTIEHKGCAVYKAANYLNITMLSNSEHFLPVSDTARRFFITTVSAARRGDHAYFEALQKELDSGGYEALLHYLLHEVDLAGFNVRAALQTEGLRGQRDQSLLPLEAWWCELLESGTLWGSNPNALNCAVSNKYQREVEVVSSSPLSGTSTQVRHVTQLGLFDQARQIEPRLRNHTNDHKLGRFLSKMGCHNDTKVLRRQGWTFPDLKTCRDAWEARFPNWEWRNPNLAEWQAEEE